MPPHDILIMAVTRMLTGICTAGFIAKPHPQSRLTWVRPVKEHGSLLLGDMTDATGRIVQMDDVVQLRLLTPSPESVHVEDWLTDFIKHRPVILRRLEGEKRASFLGEHLDRQPLDVLQHHTRSLCLIQPESMWAKFFRDQKSGKYEARIGFTLDKVRHPAHNPDHGMPVTDLRWRALGRLWLDETAPATVVQRLAYDQSELLECLSATALLLSIGLSRPWIGKTWPLVIGVHVVPDYDVVIDYNNP